MHLRFFVATLILLWSTNSLADSAINETKVKQWKEECTSGQAYSCTKVGKALKGSDPKIAKDFFKKGCELGCGVGCKNAKE